MSGSTARFCDGVSRRSVIQAGLAGIVGISMPELLRQRANADQSSRKAKTSVIYIEMAGGPTQHETYDPKPDAPLEYRGPLKSIDTSLAGVAFSEYRAEQAKILGSRGLLGAGDIAAHPASVNLAWWSVRSRSLKWS